MIFHQGNTRKYLVKTYKGKQKIVEVKKSAFHDLDHDRVKFGKLPKYSKGRKISNKALTPNTLTDSISNQNIVSEGKVINMHMFIFCL